MFDKFIHDGQEFEIRHRKDNRIIHVQVFLGDEPVGQEYHANFEADDYEHMLGILKAEARRDIEGELG